MKIAIYNRELSKKFDVGNIINKYSISEYEKVYIDRFNSGRELLSNIKSGEFYDLLFIYCNYGCDNGNIIGNEIRNELDNQNINIVYITNYKIDSSKLIDSRPIKLLTEPVTYEDIASVFIILHKLREDKENCFKVKNGNDIKFIPYKDIIYFTSTAKKISIITNKDIYTCYGKIRDLENIVGFIKVHQSFLININYIKEYTYKSLKMINNDDIPISQSLRPAVKTKMESLWIKYILYNFYIIFI